MRTKSQLFKDLKSDLPSTVRLVKGETLTESIFNGGSGKRSVPIGRVAASSDNEMLKPAKEIKVTAKPILNAPAPASAGEILKTPAPGHTETSPLADERGEQIKAIIAPKIRRTFLPLGLLGDPCIQTLVPRQDYALIMQQKPLTRELVLKGGYRLLVEKQGVHYNVSVEVMQQLPSSRQLMPFGLAPADFKKDDYYVLKMLIKEGYLHQAFRPGCRTCHIRWEGHTDNLDLLYKISKNRFALESRAVHGFGEKSSASLEKIITSMRKTTETRKAAAQTNDAVTNARESVRIALNSYDNKYGDTLLKDFEQELQIRDSVEKKFLR